MKGSPEYLVHQPCAAAPPPPPPPLAWPPPIAAAAASAARLGPRRSSGVSSTVPSARRRTTVDPRSAANCSTVPAAQQHVRGGAARHGQRKVEWRWRRAGHCPISSTRWLDQPQLNHPSKRTLLPKPAQVVCDEVPVAAARALHNHHALLVALPAEGLGRAGLALVAREDHEQLRVGKTKVEFRCHLCPRRQCGVEVVEWREQSKGGRRVRA